eukprot:scaffold2243_cov122-Cylindrotheca_fusiformis.AAC.5
MKSSCQQKGRPSVCRSKLGMTFDVFVSKRRQKSFALLLWYLRRCYPAQFCGARWDSGLMISPESNLLAAVAML